MNKELVNLTEVKSITYFSSSAKHSCNCCYYPKLWSKITHILNLMMFPSWYHSQLQCELRFGSFWESLGERSISLGIHNIKSWDVRAWACGKMLMDQTGSQNNYLGTKNIWALSEESRISSQGWGRLIFQKHGQCFKHCLTKAVVRVLIAYHRENKKWVSSSYPNFYGSREEYILQLKGVLASENTMRRIFPAPLSPDTIHLASSHLHVIKGTNTVLLVNEGCQNILLPKPVCQGKDRHYIVKEQHKSHTIFSINWYLPI